MICQFIVCKCFLIIDNYYFFIVCDYLLNGVFVLVGFCFYVFCEVIDLYICVFYMLYLSFCIDYYFKDYKFFFIFMKLDNIWVIVLIINYLDWKEFYYVYDIDYGKFFIIFG